MRSISLVLFLLPLVFQSQVWLKISDFPALERDDGVSVVVNNKAYFGTGLQTGWALAADFYALDLTTLSWSTIAAMPAGTQRQYASAFAGVNCFYVFGGDGPAGLMNNMYRYDVSLNTWSIVTSKPGIPLYGASCFTFGNSVFIVGGRTLNNQSSSEVWQYNMNSDTWQQKNNLPLGLEGRWRGAATTLNGLGFLIFGLDGNSSYRKELLSYNPQSDTWTQLGVFPYGPGRTYASLNAINNKLVLFAGWDSLGTYYNDCWYYDPLFNNWTQGPSMPSLARKGGMSCADGNKLYYSCGIDIANQRLNETWLLETPVGINEQQKTTNLIDNLVFYPNPTYDQLFVQEKNAVLNGTETFCLFDLAGNLVNHLSLGIYNNIIDFKGIEQGLYLIKVFRKNELITIKPILKIKME